MKASFIERVADVPMASLSHWFKSESPDDFTFKIKGLNSHEMALVQRVTEDNEILRQTASMLASVNNEQSVELQNVLGISTSDTPDSLAKRLKMVQLGLVEPTLSMPEVVKLAKVRWQEFTILSNEITKLSAQGYDVKK